MDIDKVLDIYYELEQIHIKTKNNRSKYIGANQRSHYLGIVPYGRNKGELSRFVRDYPHIYQMLKNLSVELMFPCNSFMLNKNVVCKPHKDGKNKGESLLVSFGDYTGGMLFVDGVEYDTYLNPIIFNGSKLEHYNTPITSGTKYSIVMFDM